MLLQPSAAPHVTAIRLSEAPARAPPAPRVTSNTERGRRLAPGGNRRRPLELHGGIQGSPKVRIANERTKTPPGGTTGFTSASSDGTAGDGHGQG